MRLISVVLSVVLLSIGLARSQTIYPSTKRVPVTSEPMMLGLSMTPQVDTLFAGDMFIFHAVVQDDTGGSRHEFDPQISWTLTPAGTASTLTGTTGGVDTLFARQAYTTYIIGVSCTNDSVVPPRVLSAFDTVYVKPGQSDHERFSIIKTVDKTKPVREYYNLSGQKMQSFGNSRMDGIVLERVVGPKGTVSVKRKFMGPDSRLQLQ